MANSRTSNSRLLAVGVAVLVVGVLLVLVIIRNTEDPAAQPSPVAAEDDPVDAAGVSTSSDDGQQMTPEQLSTARLPLPVEVPEGLEAVAVRANFMRSVAAVPSPGDVVNLYRLPQPTQEGEGREPTSPGVLPPAGPDAAPLVQEAQVLAVTGPLPASNDGTLTLVIAVPPDVVPGIMAVANEAEVWFTLLPSPDEESTEEAA